MLDVANILWIALDVFGSAAGVAMAIFMFMAASRPIPGESFMGWRILLLPWTIILQPWLLTDEGKKYRRWHLIAALIFTTTGVTQLQFFFLTCSREIGQTAMRGRLLPYLPSPLIQRAMAALGQKPP